MQWALAHTRRSPLAVSWVLRAFLDVIVHACHLTSTSVACPYVLLHLLSLIAVISGAEVLSKASLLHRYIVFAARTAPAPHVRGDELR